MRINGQIVWYSTRDGNGIVEDANGTEYYIDNSCINNKEDIKEYGRVKQFVDFVLNKNITDCRCGMDVNVYKIGVVS